MTTSLPVTRLGRTDMLLTRVGFGAWAIGGGGWAFAWGNQDDIESTAAIRHAVESPRDRRRGGLGVHRGLPGRARTVHPPRGSVPVLPHPHQEHPIARIPPASRPLFS
jgi:hypothetical protein